MSSPAPSHELNTAFDQEIRQAISAATDDAWSAAERAHILSQPWAGKHVRSHFVMARIAFRTLDVREFVGQLVRLGLAAPGSWTGRYPQGNTGRATISMFLPMEVPEDLAALLDGCR